MSNFFLLHKSLPPTLLKGLPTLLVFFQKNVHYLTLITGEMICMQNTGKNMGKIRVESLRNVARHGKKWIYCTRMWHIYSKWDLKISFGHILLTKGPQWKVTEIGAANIFQLFFIYFKGRLDRKTFFKIVNLCDVCNWPIKKSSSCEHVHSIHYKCRRNKV